MATEFRIDTYEDRTEIVLVVRAGSPVRPEEALRRIGRLADRPDFTHEAFYTPDPHPFVDTVQVRCACGWRQESASQSEAEMEHADHLRGRWP